MVVLSAYFDESVRRRSDILVVAGALFFPHKARLFQDEWLDLFGTKGFHAVKFNSAGRVRELGVDNHTHILDKAARMFVRHSEFVVGIACKISEAKEAFGARDGEHEAHATCCALAAMSVSRFLKENLRREYVTYQFEKGRKSSVEIDDVFVRIASRPDMRSLYRYDSHGFAQKQNPLVQSGDFLAWEFGRDLELRNGAPWAFEHNEARRSCFRKLVDGFRARARTRKRAVFLDYGHYRTQYLRLYRDWVHGLRANVPRK